uniref:Uncharacterized protein n=1 Tax=uncultured marine virus TaxID=186617 RepID=A0A0F7L5M5_9VIRU|nr:hypothetical protein [uncultured marine virus]
MLGYFGFEGDGVLDRQKDHIPLRVTPTHPPRQYGRSVAADPCVLGIGQRE